MLEAQTAYEPLINSIVASVRAQDFMFCECQCFRLPMRDGAIPGDFQSVRQAARAWVSNSVYRVMYWSVHLNGRHVLHIRNHHGLTAAGGYGSG